MSNYIPFGSNEQNISELKQPLLGDNDISNAPLPPAKPLVGSVTDSLSNVVKPLRQPEKITENSRQVVDHDHSNDLPLGTTGLEHVDSKYSSEESKNTIKVDKKRVPFAGLALDGRSCEHSLVQPCIRCILKDMGHVEAGHGGSFELGTIRNCAMCVKAFRIKYGNDIKISFKHIVPKRQVTKLSQVVVTNVPTSEPDTIKIMKDWDSELDEKAHLKQKKVSGLPSEKGNNDVEVEPDSDSGEISGSEELDEGSSDEIDYPVTRLDKPAGSFLLDNIENRDVSVRTKMFKVKQAVQYGVNMGILSNDSNMPTLLGGFYGTKEIWVEMPETIVNELKVFWSNPIKEHDSTLLCYEQTVHICKHLMSRVADKDSLIYLNTTRYAPLLAYYESHVENAPSFALLMNKMWSINYFGVLPFIFMFLEHYTHGYKLNWPFALLLFILTSFGLNKQYFIIYYSYVKIKLMLDMFVAVSYLTIHLVFLGLTIHLEDVSNSKIELCTNYLNLYITDKTCNIIIIVLTAVVTVLLVGYRYYILYGQSITIVNSFSYGLRSLNISVNGPGGYISRYLLRRQLSLIKFQIIIGVVELFFLGFLVDFNFGFILYIIVRYINMQIAKIGLHVGDLVLW